MLPADLPGTGPGAYQVRRPRLEREVIADNARLALSVTDGNIVQAAGLIGVSAKTLYNWLSGDSRRNLGLVCRQRKARKRRHEDVVEVAAA